MEKITLTPSEQYFVEERARKAVEHNEKTGVCDTPYGGTSLEKYILGFGGELSFCKIFNIYADLTFDNYETNKFDAYYHGFEIEIKTNSREDGWVSCKDIPKIIDSPPAYFSLMIGVFPTYDFRGFISASSLINPWHYISSKKFYHPLFVAYQNELIEELPNFAVEVV
jgi:hypothetical protein